MQSTFLLFVRRTSRRGTYTNDDQGTGVLQRNRSASSTCGSKSIYAQSEEGGLHRALQISNVNATVVRAFDWDQTSCRVYEANHGPGTVKKVGLI